MAMTAYEQERSWEQGKIWSTDSHCEAHIHSFNNSYQMPIIKHQPPF